MPDPISETPEQSRSDKEKKDPITDSPTSIYLKESKRSGSTYRSLRKILKAFSFYLEQTSREKRQYEKTYKENH